MKKDEFNFEEKGTKRLEERMKISVKKTEKRLCEYRGKIFALFLLGGETSKNFHYSEVGRNIEIAVDAICNDSFFSVHTLLYIN